MLEFRGKSGTSQGECRLMEKLRLNLVLYLLHFVTLVAPQNVPSYDTQVRIDCGGYRNFTNQFNESWIADKFFTGGLDAVVLDPGIFSQPQETTLRFFPTTQGKKNCYIVPVPNGRYFIQMFFVYNNYDKNMHTPSFDVSVEGTVVFSWRSPWGNTAAQQGAYADLYTFVEDKSVSVCFYSIATDSPVIGALEIIQVDPLSYDAGSTGDEVILVNYGRVTAGPESFGSGLSTDRDTQGRDWTTDDSYSPTPKSYIQTSEPIRGSNVAPNYFPTKVYQSARQVEGSGSIEYYFNVDSSLDYMIWLHFAEIQPDVTAPGQRVFNISVNDQVVEPSLDIFKEVGNYAVLDWNYTLRNITDTNLVIKLIPVAGVPTVCGVEVLAILPVEPATDNSEVSTMEDLKNSLHIPDRLGWNGDPCVPPSWEAWQGVTCYWNSNNNGHVIGRLDLSNQGLKGILGNRITDLGHLDYLNLSMNMIGGDIPDGLGSHSLTTVDLSQNLFTGSIPESLGSSQLKQVILSGNLLEGQVPEAVYSIGVHGGVINLSFNQGLCGVPSLPPCPHFWEKSRLSGGAKAGIALGVIIGVTVSIALAIVCIRKKRSREDYNFSLPHQLAMRHKRYMLHRASMQFNGMDDTTMMRVNPSKYGFSSMSPL